MAQRECAVSIPKLYLLGFVSAVHFFLHMVLTRLFTPLAQYFPASVVIGQTNTDNAHDRLVSLGIMPRLKRDAGEEKFSFVVFSAPPSGSEDYTAEVEAALKLWDGTGAFVFTSSTAVYDAADGEPCDETTPQFKIGESPRADRLLKAEEAVLGAGGCVVRLAGLYHSQVSVLRAKYLSLRLVTGSSESYTR